MSANEQTPLITTDEIVVDSTVWVLAADMMGGGHPQVLGVYDNEAAAREHEEHIRRRGGVVRKGEYDHDVASFWTYEKEVQSEFEPPEGVQT